MSGLNLTVPEQLELNPKSGSSEFRHSEAGHALAGATGPSPVSETWLALTHSSPQGVSGQRDVGVTAGFSLKWEAPWNVLKKSKIVVTRRGGPLQFHREVANLEVRFVENHVVGGGFRLARDDRREMRVPARHRLKAAVGQKCFGRTSASMHPYLQMVAGFRVELEGPILRRACVANGRAGLAVIDRPKHFYICLRKCFSEAATRQCDESPLSKQSRTPHPASRMQRPG